MRRPEDLPCVGVWRWRWLPSSETFIFNQFASYRTWSPHAISAKHVSSSLAGGAVNFIYGTKFVDRFLRQLYLRTKRSFRLLDVLNENSLSLVHAHFGTDAILISKEVARAGLPLVITLHGYDVTVAPFQPGRRGRAYLRQLRKVFEQSVLILAVSEHIAAKAIELGADPRKVKVHYVGVPVPPQRPWLDEGYIVFVGRLVEKKGVADLLEAVSCLPANLRSTPIHIVGDGHLRPMLEERAEDLGINVKFHGRLESAKAKSLMASSRVVVVPSHRAANGDTEGLPTVVFEAMAEGKPVVAYSHAGIPEAVDHGSTGILVEERDTTGLSEALRTLIADPLMAQNMGAEARSVIESRFNIAEQTTKLERLYDTVVQGR